MPIEVMIIIVILMFAIAIYLFKQTKAFLKTAIETEGVVVDIVWERTGGSNNGGSYYPVFEFEDENGNYYEVLSGSGSNPPAYHVGDNIKVIYDENNPQKARVNSLFSLWGATVITSIIGIGFLVATLAQ